MERPRRLNGGGLWAPARNGGLARCDMGYPWLAKESNSNRVAKELIMKRRLRSNFPRGSYLWSVRLAQWRALGQWKAAAGKRPASAATSALAMV